MIYIREEERSLFKYERRVADFFKIDGHVSKEIKNRRTLRFKRGNESFYIKCHQGVGWREILKNLTRLQLPVVSAYTEWLAIQRLNEIGVPTVTGIGYGVEGLNPAGRRSFTITKDLGATRSLEQVTSRWSMNPPPPKIKWALIRKLAEIARQLHQNGVNHRDFYLCHFLLMKEEPVSIARDPVDIKLFLIDLHRVQIRRQTPNRYKIKDIGGLYFSSMDIGLKERDLFRFMKAYQQQSLRKILFDKSEFWLKISRKALALWRSQTKRKK